MMQHESRAVVAAAAYAVSTGNQVSNVVDHSSGSTLMISASCEGDEVRALDARRGALEGKLPALFDHGGATFIDMKRDENKITGFHYQSVSFYQVQITGRLVEMYDFGDHSWSAFSMA